MSPVNTKNTYFFDKPQSKGRCEVGIQAERLYGTYRINIQSAAAPSSAGGKSMNRYLACPST